jgi:hypothetical protein
MLFPWCSDGPGTLCARLALKTSVVEPDVQLLPVNQETQDAEKPHGIPSTPRP